MTRQLRPRKSRPSYILNAGFVTDEDEETPQAGPSSASRTPFEDEVDSESDFEPEARVEIAAEDHAQNDHEDEDEDAEGEIDDDVEEEVVAVVKPKQVRTASKRKRSPEPVKLKGRVKSKIETAAKVIVGPKGTKRQQYVLPTPSVHHRHRAVPLYSREGRVERLVNTPSLFTRPVTTLTNGFTENSKVSERVNKSWGYNIGAGPLWDLAEDRAWYKEAITTGEDTETEHMRRPRVYENVPLLEGWEILKEE